MITIRSSIVWLTRCAFIALALTAIGVPAQTSGNLLTGSFSGLVFNRATNTFNSILTLTNNGPALPAPLTISISTGVASVSVKGASSLGGSSYGVPVTLPRASLTNGQSVQVVVAFVNPARVAFTPTLTAPPPVQAQVDPTLTVTSSIDASGGSLSVATPGGIATLAVPPSGLSGATRISMTPIIGFTGRTPSGWLAGVQLEPSGLQFLQPVSLTFQLPSTPASGPTVAYVFQDDGTQMYEDMAVVTGSTATVQLTHFTGAGVAASSCSAPLPFDPTWTPEQLALTKIHYAVACLMDDPEYHDVVEGALAYWFDLGIVPGLENAPPPGLENAPPPTVSSLTAAVNAFVRWEKIGEVLDFNPNDPVIDSDDSVAKDIAAASLATIQNKLLQNCNCEQLTANPISEAQTDANMVAAQKMIDVLGWPQLDPLIESNPVMRSCQVLTLRDSLNVATGVASVTFVPLALLTPAVTLQVGQSIPVSSVFDNSEPQVPPNASVQWTSADSAVATTDSTSINAVGPGATTLTVEASQCGNAPVTTPSPLQVSVCGLNGTWQGTYSGHTIRCLQRNANGCCTSREGADLSGAIAVTFSQRGANVSASAMGETITGTDNAGEVSLATTVPAHCGTVEVPAGLDGTISADCSTFSGTFYSDRVRTVSGTFTLTAPPQ